MNWRREMLISCNKCNNQYSIDASGGYICLCNECLSVCDTNYEHELFMKSFDIFLGENLIANVEWKKQPVIHNSYFFKLQSVFGEKRLQSQDAEDAVKESVDCMINHVKDMRQKEAERLVGVIVEEYNAKEFSKESTFSGWGVYHEGLYEGNCYDVTLIGDKQVVIHTAVPICKQSKKTRYKGRCKYRTQLNAKEFDDIYKCTMYVSLYGYLFEVIAVSEHLSNVMINDHMKKEADPSLYDSCPISFTHNFYEGTYKDLSPEETAKIDKVRIEKRSIKSDILGGD